MTLPAAYNNPFGDDPIPGTLRPAYGTYSTTALAPAYGLVNPLPLFFPDRVGALYDPLDLYQDSAVPPVTPASTVGDPIGTIVSQVSGGFNWRQATAGNKMTLGNLPRGGYWNRLIQTNLVGGTGWTAGLPNITVATNSADVVDPFGGNNASKITITGAATLLARQGSLSFVAGAAVASIYLYVPPGQPGVTQWRAFANWNDGDLSNLVTSTTFGAWVRLNLASTLTTSRTILDFELDSGTGVLPAGTVAYLIGAQAERGSVAAAYQRVGAAYDVTQSGVPTLQMPYFGGDDYAVLSVNGTGVQELSSTADYFADTGKAWAVGGAFSTFTAGTVLFAKSSATGATSTLQILINGSGVLVIVLRGTFNNTGLVVTDGRIYSLILACNNGSVSLVVNGTTYAMTVGSASEESEIVLLGARTSSSPAGFVVGFMTTPVLLGYAPSAAQIAQYMSWARNYYGSP